MREKETAELRDAKKRIRMLEQENEILRRAAAFFATAVLDLAADGIPVAVTCRVLGFSRQAFYKWEANPVSDRDWADAHLISAALDIHADDPAFGHRFIADELPALGIRVGENRVQRLCKSQRIWSSLPRSGDSPARPARRSATIWSGGTSSFPPRMSCG